MLSQLDIARFTTADAAAALGVTTGSMKARLHRGDVALGSDEVAETRNPGTGRSRLFSARRILHLALTEALVGVGLPVAESSRLALNFTDSNGSDEPEGVLEDATAPEERELGEPYPDGRTVFRVLLDHSGTPIAGRVDRLASIAGNPLLNDNTPCAAAVLIDLNALYDRTMAKLGIRP